MLGKLGDDLRKEGTALGEYTNNIMELRAHCSHLEGALYVPRRKHFADSRAVITHTTDDVIIEPEI